MQNTSVIIPTEVVRRCRGVLLDLGSTLLEYENTPFSELFPISFKSAYDYLINNSPKTPDYDAFYAKFKELTAYFRKRAVNEYKEYQFNEITAPLLTAFRIPPTPELLQGFFEHYYIKITEQVTVYPNAKTTLSRIKAAGRSICIVSNTCFPGKVHRAEMARFGLFKFIDYFIFSSDVGVRKPHRDIYLKAIKRLGLEADEVIFAGDRQLEDALGPQMVGIQPVLVRRRHREYEPGLTTCPEVNGLAGLPGLLQL